ncbi:hypothetical protein HWV62_2559 [Athelia sp. TMB]|nr:hypothetical protein HWV62_2559 [Athelia sp. TMB]
MDFDYQQHQRQHQQQQQQQQQQQWPPHLIHTHPSAYPSPVSPPAPLEQSQNPQSQSQYSYYNTQGQPDRAPTQSLSLSMNLAGLSVASPTNVSPINPSPLHTHQPLTLSHPHQQGAGHHPGLSHSHSSSTVSSTISPVTPISPGPHHSFHGQHQQFQFDPAWSSRSSSSGEAEKTVPRKRSFSSHPPPTGNPPEGGLAVNMYTPNSFRPYDGADTAMDVSSSSASYLDPHASNTANGSPIENGGISPVEGGGSSMGDDDGDGDGEDIEGEREDQLKPLSAEAMPGGELSGMGILGGKAPGTNNFVAKLYQMISDPSSSRFISWTELGTSFVVSNVGEFSRSILGSHFKHNNFSSFVRQLNMYGFHKINRTPRSQRTSTDAQTWEFSHHKFLRGRPDLLDEIKRKALETGPNAAASADAMGKLRMELPGEMMVMREENRRVWDALVAERRKVDRLTSVVRGLWEVVGKGFPGSVPPFPSDLLEGGESPNIYITSPTSAGMGPGAPGPRLSTSQSLQSLHSHAGSPISSPTTAEFAHVAPSLSRQHSYQQIPPHATTPPEFEGEDRGGAKRQRTSKSTESLNMNLGMNGGGDASEPKRVSRARSDSAPLGYGGGGAGWGRPRSGSSLATRGGTRPGTASSGGGGTPLLSIPTLNTNPPGR